MPSYSFSCDHHVAGLHSYFQEKVSVSFNRPKHKSVTNASFTARALVAIGPLGAYSTVQSRMSMRLCRIHLMSDSLHHSGSFAIDVFLLIGRAYLTEQHGGSLRAHD